MKEGKKSRAKSGVSEEVTEPDGLEDTEEGGEGEESELVFQPVGGVKTKSKTKGKARRKSTKSRKGKRRRK